MASIAEVEKLASKLSDAERTVLAAHLLKSLPPLSHNEDKGAVEALRREAAQGRRGDLDHFLNAVPDTEPTESDRLPDPSHPA